MTRAELGAGGERAVSWRSEDALRLLWAAFVIARDIWTCEAILRARPVRAGNLDAEALRRALRGAPLPLADDYLTVGREMLDALAEALPLTPKRKR
jgi:hypothetical protein